MAITYADRGRGRYVQRVRTTRTDEERERDNAKIESDILRMRHPDDARRKLLPEHDRRLHCKVAGVKFNNPDGSSRQAAIERMAQFDLVELVRDPDDQWDANAVEVWARVPAIGSRPSAIGRTPQGAGHGEPRADSRQPTAVIQIGHLPAELAAELAPEMDAGTRWGAIVTRVGGYISRGVGLMLFRCTESQ